MTRKQENLMTLKHLLGMNEEKATLLITKQIKINAGKSEDENLCVDYLCEILSKTYESVTLSSIQDICDVEVIIGNRSPITSAPRKVYLSWDSDKFIISLNEVLAISGSLPPILLKLGTAFSCGAVITQTTEHGKIGRGERFPMVLEFKKYFGTNLNFLEEEIDLGLLHVAGLGATGNWFVDGLSLLNVKGKIKSYDDDNVSAGNTQRTRFLLSQVGMKKVFAYRELFFPRNKSLEFIPVAKRIQDAIIEAGQPFEKIVCCVDSRAARRDIQSYAPKYVFDCSTTDISELTLFFGRSSSDCACLSCLYFETTDEDARYKDIANVLGVDLSEVKSERIDSLAAIKISKNYPEFLASDLIGIPYDTFHKQLCGAGKLLPSKIDNESTVKNAVAPFCHISVIAGLMLAIEVTRRHHFGLEKKSEWNCWRINPWTVPQSKLSMVYFPIENCSFHLNSIKIANEIWKNSEQLLNL